MYYIEKFQKKKFKRKKYMYMYYIERFVMTLKSRLQTQYVHCTYTYMGDHQLLQICTCTYLIYPRRPD